MTNYDNPNAVEAALAQEYDPINHPAHYTEHPSGVECIQITEHMSFTLGNAVKYIWRADLKGDAIADLRKAAWYVNREIERREKRVKSGRADAEELLQQLTGGRIEHLGCPSCKHRKDMHGPSGCHVLTDPATTCSCTLAGKF